MSRLAVRDEQVPMRRATNISLDAAMVQNAKGLGINVSRACEKGLAAEIKAERERRWLEENQAAIDGYNAWIEENGLPLAEHRLF